MKNRVGIVMISCVGGLMILWAVAARTRAHGRLQKSTAGSIAEGPAASGVTTSPRSDARRELPHFSSAKSGSPSSSPPTPAAATKQPRGPQLEKPESPAVEDGRENRRHIIQDIVASGLTTEDWSRHAPVAFSNFMNAVPQALADQIDVDSIECFKKACMAHVSYADMGTYERTNPLFLGSDAFRSWAGAKGRTAVETLDSGRVEVTWLLMNPTSEGWSAAAPE